MNGKPLSRKTPLAFALCAALVAGPALAQTVPAPPSAPAAFSNNTALPGFAAASSSNDSIPHPPSPPWLKQQGGAAVDPYLKNNGQPPTTQQILHMIAPHMPHNDTYHVHRLQTSIRAPAGAEQLPSAPPSLPGFDPSPVTTTTTPGNTIDPSKLHDGTVKVSGSHIEATAGDTTVYLLTVSSSAPNMIHVPFNHPRLLTTSRSAVNFSAHGHDMVVTVTSEGPVGAYITGQNPGDPLIGVTFDPQSIPPRSYILDVKGFVPPAPTQAASGSQGSGSGSDVNSAYVSQITAILRDVVTGTAPDGFGLLGTGRLPIDQMFEGVRLHPTREYTDGVRKVLVLRATNQTTGAVRLVENDFYAKGVQGVVIDPTRMIHPGQSTDIYVLSGESSHDPSLLGVWQGGSKGE